MGKGSRKKLFSLLFFFAVMALTFWYVFRNEDLYQVLDYLADADVRYVIPAIGAVVAFILGESVVLWYLLRQLGTRSSFWHCALYSFIGFFYSAITPSASGGQPMQVVAMRKDKIPGAVSAVMLAIVTITYKLVLVFLGVAVLLFRPQPIIGYLEEVEALMYVGLALNIIAICALMTLVFHPAVIRKAVRLGVRLVHKIRPFKDLEKASARWEASINQYSGTAAFFRQKPRIIAKVFLITLVQRFCLFSVVWFTYMAFGLSGQSAIVVTALYGMISVAVDMLPLPGGMGISETLFLVIFAPVFGQELVLPGMLVCRGLSYYTQLIISGLMTGVSQFVIRDQEKSGIR